MHARDQRSSRGPQIHLTRTSWHNINDQLATDIARSAFQHAAVDRPQPSRRACTVPAATNHPTMNVAACRLSQSPGCSGHDLLTLNHSSMQLQHAHTTRTARSVIMLLILEAGAACRRTALVHAAALSRLVAENGTCGKV